MYWVLEACKCPYPISRYSLVRIKQSCLRTPNCQNLQKLIDLSNFAKEIANKSGKRVRCLTKDTGNCLCQTCNGLVESMIIQGSGVT